jgi:hypothetical protein
MHHLFSTDVYSKILIFPLVSKRRISMSPQLEAILEQAQGLPREEQLELIRKLTEQRDMQLSDEAKPKRKVTDFYGVAPNLLSGMDAQVWVEQLRSEWDKRRDVTCNVST